MHAGIVKYVEKSVIRTNHLGHGGDCPDGEDHGREEVAHPLLRLHHKVRLRPRPGGCRVMGMLRVDRTQ